MIEFGWVMAAAVTFFPAFGLLWLPLRRHHPGVPATIVAFAVGVWWFFWFNHGLVGWGEGMTTVVIYLARFVAVTLAVVLTVAQFRRSLA